MEPGREVKPQADSRLRVRLMCLGPQRRLSMAPVTIARFVQELEKLKQVSDAEKLKPQEYDSRLARIIQELREKGLDALEVLLFPGDVEHFVAVPAAQRRQAFGERHALAAIGAHPVLGHPGKPGRILGTWHDGPAVRRSTDDIEKRAGDVHGFAEDVEQRLARPEFLDVVP